MKPLPLVITMLALGLSACSQEQREEEIDILALTGLSAPIETGAAQQQREGSIRSRADTMILSTFHVGEGTTSSIEFLTDCSGSQCELQIPSSGETSTISLADLASTPTPDIEAVGSRYGVTLVEENALDQGTDATSFGAWMDHSYFSSVTSNRPADEVGGGTDRYTWAAGERTGSPLTGSATWLGLMVGTPIAGNDMGDRLVGTAALNYDMTVGGLDVAFSGIKNITRGTAHTTETVIFSDLAIESDGAFKRGQAGARIHGNFYGPGHDEAAGIFEHSQMIGAFGAKQQQ